MNKKTQTELETGIVKLDSPFYVKRKTDRELLDLIRKTGSTILIKGASKTGKSSLLARAEAEAKKLQHQICHIDFQILEDSDFSSLEKLLKRIANKISWVFKTHINPNDFWDEMLSTKENITEFIKEAVLKKSHTPVLFLFDEIERVFFCPFRNDFFSTIRVWHNLMRTDEHWKHLNVIIAHFTEIHLWIEDIDQSPFNIGTHFVLGDFEFQHIKDLKNQCGLTLNDDDVWDVLDYTEGQPFLVRWAYYHLLISPCSITYLKEVVAQECGYLNNFLQRFLSLLEVDEGLKKSFLQALKHGRCDNTSHFYWLKSLGLVKGDSHKKVRIYCQLYRDYFEKKL